MPSNYNDFYSKKKDEKFFLFVNLETQAHTG